MTSRRGSRPRIGQSRLPAGGSPLGRVAPLVLLAIAAVYNPVFPVPLPAGAWSIAGLVAGTVLGLSTLEAAPHDPHLPRYQAAFWLGT